MQICKAENLISKEEKINWLKKYEIAFHRLCDLEYRLITERDISALVLKEAKAENSRYSLDDILIKSEELKEEYKRTYEELKNTERNIIYSMRLIKDPAVYRILYLRYIGMLDWAEIADRMGYSKSSIYRLHSKGLEQVTINTPA